MTTTRLPLWMILGAEPPTPELAARKATHLPPPKPKKAKPGQWCRQKVIDDDGHEFNSIKDAADFYGMPRSTMAYCIKNRVPAVKPVTGRRVLVIKAAK